jgi:hypothetical protein
MASATFETNDPFIQALQTEDELGLVVRAHIHIEAQLTKFLELFARGEYLNKAQLEFNQRVYLAIAFGLKEEHAKPLLVLGNLRNAFSHRLDTQLSDDRVNNLYSALSGNDKQVVQQSYDRTESRMRQIGKKFGDLSAKDRFILIAVSLQAMLKVAIGEVERRGVGSPFR